MDELLQSNSPYQTREFIVFPYRMPVDDWLKYGLETIEWLWKEFIKGYEYEEGKPRLFILLSLQWEREGQESGGFLKKLFKKKKKPHEQLLEDFRKMATESKQHLIVFDELGGVPMRYVDEWLQEFILNELDRTKVLNSIFAKTQQELETALSSSNKTYQPEAALDMSLIEQVLGHIVEANQPKIEQETL